MAIELLETQESCNVSDFYAGRSVFITGGTGFIGKVLIEKLLYSCPEIDKIYVLVRDKRGVTAEKRIQEMTKNILFSKLRAERPDDLKKIIPISGDIGTPSLGINPKDVELLIEKVSVVFHAAATIKFNEPLKVALKINLEGTAQVLRLCQRMKNIHVFVHVSTAYSNTDKQVIEEIVYPPPADIDDVYVYTKQQNDDECGAKILNGRPNTYTFTKALAETFIEKNHGEVPTIIIRPSIVSAIEDGPMNGWVDNWYGATGFLTTIARGLNRIIYGRSENIVDLIPVDYVTNFLIVAAAKGKRSNEVPVYNCCSSSCNPIALGKLVKMFVEEAIVHRDYVLPCPNIYFIVMATWVLPMVTLFMQLMPAYLADIWRFLRGKAPRFVKLQSKVIQTRDAVQYFTSHSWVMRSDRTRALSASLSSRDRQLFPCDPTTICWDQYIPVYCNGIRKYLERRA